MFTYTRKLNDGRFVAVVCGDRDGRYPVASALPSRDRNQAARNGVIALHRADCGWETAISMLALAYIDDLLRNATDQFERRARAIAIARKWTVEFTSDGCAWFYDDRMHDVAQSDCEAHLDALERSPIKEPLSLDESDSQSTKRRSNPMQYVIRVSKVTTGQSWFYLSTGPDERATKWNAEKFSRDDAGVVAARLRREGYSPEIVPSPDTKVSENVWNAAPTR